MHETNIYHFFAQTKIIIFSLKKTGAGDKNLRRNN
jgi:hypothetical protein